MLHTMYLQMYHTSKGRRGGRAFNNSQQFYYCTSGCVVHQPTIILKKTPHMYVHVCTYTSITFEAKNNKNHTWPVAYFFFVCWVSYKTMDAFPTPGAFSNPFLKAKTPGQPYIYIQIVVGQS